MKTILSFSSAALVLGAPFFTVILAISIACFYFVDEEILALQMILIEMNRLASMPILVALPLFTLSGCILTSSEAPKRIMNFLVEALGWLPGGLAIASIAACAFFTALTGASGVTIVAVGSIVYPILKDQGYSEKFTLGLITTAGSLGLLFPPSLPVILYGVIANIDIGKLFKAAMLPGIILVLVLCVYAFIHQLLSKDKDKYPTTSFNVKRLWESFVAGLSEWPIVAIVLVGVYGGFVTIAEVSVLVLVYIVIVESLIRKEVHFFKELPKVVVEATVLSGAIIVILGGALGFTAFLIEEEIPNLILESITNITQNQLLFLIGLNLFLIVVGCLMDIFSAIMVIVPIMVPVAIQYGINPIHLGVVFLVNLEIGFFTPPVGINLFISSLKFKKPITVLYRACIPFLILLLGVLLVITYLPSLSIGFLK